MWVLVKVTHADRTVGLVWVSRPFTVGEAVHRAGPEVLHDHFASNLNDARRFKAALGRALLEVYLFAPLDFTQIAEASLTYLVQLIVLLNLKG